MIVKSTLLAVVIFLGSLSLAEAQYVNGGVPNQLIQLGWNWGYVYYCQTLNDSVNTWHFAFFQDGGYAFTNNPGYNALFAAACTGSRAGIHVTSLNPFLWNSAAVLPQ
jgi:hypothetical protein